MIAHNLCVFIIQMILEFNILARISVQMRALMTRIEHLNKLQFFTALSTICLAGGIYIGALAVEIVWMMV